jgi:hypothetical protein
MGGQHDSSLQIGRARLRRRQLRVRPGIPCAFRGREKGRRENQNIGVEKGSGN